MNFLAHVYLSQSPPELLVGNFIGDFVKGKAFEDYPEIIQKGIILHREIDGFTDENPWVRKSKKRLVPKYRHYAGVIVDMFYDHFLASLWKDYHHQKLEKFAGSTYKILNKHWNYLPKGAQFMLPYMIEQNWLKNYATTKGIHRALSGLSSRSRFTSYMEEATQDLQLHYEEFKAEFSMFFPIIIDHVEDWKLNNLESFQ